MIKDFFKFSIGSWLAAALSFFTTPIITFFISPENFGIAAIFSTTTAVLLQVVILGTDQSFMRFFYERSESERPNLLWNSFIPALCCWGIISILLILFGEYFSEIIFEQENSILIILLSLDLVIRLFERYALLIIRMQQKGLWFSGVRFLNAAFAALCVILYCTYIEKSFYAIIISGISAAFLASLIAIVLERKFWFYSFRISRIEIVKILRYGGPLVFACLLSLVFETMDKYFLRFLADFEQLGLYAAAFKIVAILAIVQMGFSMYWTPVSFEHYEKDPTDTIFYEKVFHSLYVLFIPLALLVILFKDIIILILSKTYVESAAIMPFLVFIPLMYTLTEVSCIGIYFLKKTIWQTYIFFILLCCSAGLNYILIPMLGAKGAALTMALVYLLYFYSRTMVSIRLYPMHFHLWKVTIYLSSLFVVAFINTFLLDNLYGKIIALMMLCVFLYCERKVILSFKGKLYYYIKK